MTTRFSEDVNQYGTSDWCPHNPDGMSEHEPDWTTLVEYWDGELYIDVNCKHCGRSGCIGTAKTLAEETSW